MTSVALGTGLIIHHIGIAYAQQAARSDPSFDVVSVKPCGEWHHVPGPDVSGTPAAGLRRNNTTPLRYTDRTFAGVQTMSHIIQHAYSVAPWEKEGPTWMDSLTYEIRATMPPGTTQNTAKLMLRTMLAERFGFRFHHETREVPVYALIEARRGFKLHEESRPGLMYGRMDRSRFATTGTIDSMVNYFRSYSDLPVINKTEIKGVYHLELSWPQDDPPDSSGYNRAFWTVLEREVGLKIEKRKLHLDVMVIDHIERVPTPN